MTRRERIAAVVLLGAMGLGLFGLAIMSLIADWFGGNAVWTAVLACAGLLSLILAADFAHFRHLWQVQDERPREHSTDSQNEGSSDI